MRPRLALALAACLLLAAPVVGCGGEDAGAGTEAVEEAIADSLEIGGGGRPSVSKLVVDGPRATAEVGFTGGGLDGQVVTVKLVEADGEWELKRVVGFAEYEPEALARALEARFEAASPELTSAQISCLGEAFRSASKREAEALLLRQSAQGLVGFATSCE